MSRTRASLLLALLTCLTLPALAAAEEAGDAPPKAHRSQFGAGQGPTEGNGTYRLLDEARTKRQSNAIAFDQDAQGHHRSVSLTCALRVLEGGESMARALLWVRYGFCTCLGLAVIGLAAVSGSGSSPEASSMPHPGPVSSG